MRAKIWTLAIMAALAVAGPAGAASRLEANTHDCLSARTAHKAPDTQTLRLQAASLRAAYKAGEVVQVAVAVTRHVAGGTTRPAEDVEVAVGLTIGDQFVLGSGTTSADGKVVISVDTWNDAEAGWAKVRVTAWKDYLEGPCHTTVGEYGRQSYKRFVKIRS